ncbi:unnamed protein product, partial [Urochloa humidicola]
HTRLVNGILGLLCKEHFPGMVMHASKYEPAYTFQHYYSAEDQVDPLNRVFDNKAERVKHELWDFFRCEDGYEARAQLTAHKACKKLLHDMHYEARIQAIINYYASEVHTRVTKKQARNMMLTKEQFLQVPPNWCNNHGEAWEKMVDRWTCAEWLEKHQIAREKRLKMKGPAYHQGNLNLRAFAKRYSDSHGGQPVSQVKAWALAHMGKATADIDYSLDTPASAFTNSTIAPRLNAYTERAREVYGPEYDPSTQDFDGRVVMEVGGGKKHG